MVATGFAALFWTTTAAALIALPFAEPISEALLDRPDAELARIAIGGLWVLTLWEYALTLLRLDERARAYFAFTIANVLVAIPVTVWLVVGRGPGRRRDPARQLRHRRRRSSPGGCGASAAGSRSCPTAALLRRMVRFGLPTMPAELSLYSLNFIDRIIIVAPRRPRRGGPLRARDQVRPGDERAGPRLPARLAAARLLDRRTTTRPAAPTPDRHLVRRRLRVRRRRPLAAGALDRPTCSPRPSSSRPTRRSACSPTGIALYALYLVLVVILGRTGRTEFNFPATIGGHGRQRRPQPDPDPAARDRRRRASRWSPPTWWCWCSCTCSPSGSSRSRTSGGGWRCSSALAAALIAAGELLLPTEGIGGFADPHRAVAGAARCSCSLRLRHREPSARALGAMLRPAAVRARLRGARRDREPRGRGRAARAGGLRGGPRDEDRV